MLRTVLGRLPFAELETFMRNAAVAVVVASLTSSAAIAQLTVVSLPSPDYRLGKVLTFSPAGRAVTGYVISDGPGGDSAPRAFTYNLGGQFRLDDDNYTMGLSVSDDGLTGVRAIGSISGVGIDPQGSKVGPINGAGFTLLNFKAVAASDSGLHLAGFDPLGPTTVAFSRRNTDNNAITTLPTLASAPSPKTVSLARDGRSMSINFYRTIFEPPTPTVFTDTYGLSPLPIAPGASWGASTQISGDGATVAGFSTFITNGLYSTVGGFWNIENGQAARFNELVGFTRVDSVSFDGTVMLGYGEQGQMISHAGLGAMTFADYLATAGITLPTDWTYVEVSSMSADGLRFSGFATLEDGQTDVLFTVTVPSPASGLLLGVGALLATRRRRSR